jgi:hypothetical protein
MRYVTEESRGFDSLVTSVWISSLGEMYESKTCSLFNDN